MRTLFETELLQIWDHGADLGPLARALGLLAAAYPEFDPEELAHEAVGTRDRRLLALREALFGSAVAGTTFCPECRERADLNFSVDDVLVPASEERTGELSVEVGNYRIAFRLPCTIDLATVPTEDGMEGVRAFLLARCLNEVTSDGESIAVGELAAEAIEAVLGEMAAADPQADIQIEVLCPACGHRWNIIFDIVPFLWSEIDSWAHGIMREVYMLAQVTGWNESEIFSLSPRRRRTYLAMTIQ